MRTVPTEEQETTINMEAQSKTAEIYTCEPNTIRTMQKLAEAHPDEVVIEHPDDYGIIVRLPRRFISIRAPKKMKYTEEKLKEMAEKMRELRQRQLASRLRSDS